jgi:hypothetical protein
MTKYTAKADIIEEESETYDEEDESEEELKDQFQD